MIFWIRGFFLKIAVQSSIFPHDLTTSPSLVCKICLINLSFCSSIFTVIFMLGKSRGTCITMDKNDMLYLAAALVLVLVIALVIKPTVTGQPLNTGIASSTITSLPLSVTYPVSQIPHQVSTATSTIPTSKPTPAPTWNPNASQTVAFVNPSPYGVSFNQSLTGSSNVNTTFFDTNMTTFATISSDTGSSGTTSVFYMPFPFWELVYTVNPVGETIPVSEQVTPTMGVGLSHSGVSGSYSTVTPQFTLQVIDGDDPNRIVRTISPPGGINLNLWLGVVPTTPVDTSNFKTNQLHPITPAVTQSLDPRPWTEIFYEGQHHYYFVITAKGLESYSINIEVPKRYIGQY